MNKKADYMESLDPLARNILLIIAMVLLALLFYKVLGGLG
jgi:hypothetical protein